MNSLASKHSVGDQLKNKTLTSDWIMQRKENIVRPSQVADQEATQDTEFLVFALTEMGFTDAESRRAVLATSNAGVAQAIEYAIGHGSRAPIAAAAPYFAPSRNSYMLDVQAAAAAPASVGSQAAAAAPVVVERSIVYNGRVYKSLADHDPHSTARISEGGNLYNLGAGWRLCPKTPDALHVCKTYPWAALALVFEDGSAHFTENITRYGPDKRPGAHFNS